MKEKLFIIKKQLMATSVRDALRKEKRLPADEVYLDDNWLKAQDYGKPIEGFRKPMKKK